MPTLFPAVSLAEIDHLFPTSSEVMYPENGFLFHEGETPTCLHILTTGRLQIFKYDAHTNEITLNYFEPVCLVAELAVLRRIPYPASARFITAGSVRKVGITEFEEVLQHNLRANQLLLQSLLQKLQTLDMAISRSLTMDAQCRVAHFLHHMPENCPDLKHHQIASMLVLRPETFSRILRQFKDEGILDNESGRLKLLRPDLLQKYL